MFRLRRPFGSTALVATLIVCLAPPAGQSAEPQLSIPAVVGQPAAAAKSALEAAGLVVRFRVGHAAPSEALAFTAYEMQPATGTLVSRGSTVDVLLYGKPAAASDIPSALPPAAPPAMPAAAHGIVVPNVIGMSAVDARAAITQAGLTAQFHVGQAPPSAGDAFRVYDAQPAPGSQAAQGAEVKLILYAMAGGAAGAKSTSSTAPGAMPPPAATTDAQPAVSVTPPPAAAPASATAPASTTAPRRADPVPTLSMVVASIDPAEHQSYVHDFTGLLSLSIVDLQVQAGAMELKVERQFRNGRGASGLLGRGWLLNWEKFLLHDDGELAVVGPEGAKNAI